MMKKTRTDTILEVWEDWYINMPDKRNEDDKEARIIQIEHGNNDMYIVEVLRKHEV